MLNSDLSTEPGDLGEGRLECVEVGVQTLGAGFHLRSQRGQKPRDRETKGLTAVMVSDAAINSW
jgi:hypothetical protein